MISGKVVAPALLVEKPRADEIIVKAVTSGASIGDTIDDAAVDDCSCTARIASAECLAPRADIDIYECYDGGGDVLRASSTSTDVAWCFSRSH